MKTKLHIIVTNLLLLTLASSPDLYLLGQEKSQPSETVALFLRDDHELLLNVSVEQEFAFQYVPIRTFVTPLPILRLLLDEEVSQNLEFSRSQLSELQQARRKIDTALKECEEIDAAAELSKKARDTALVDALQPACSDANALIKEILVPWQKTSLSTVLNVYQIRRRGLCSFLTSPKVVKQMSISEEQRRELNKIFATEFPAAEREISTAMGKSIEQLLGSLGLPQKEMFYESLHQEVLVKQYASLVWKQLDKSYISEALEKNQNYYWPELQPLSTVRRYNLMLNGALIEDGKTTSDDDGAYASSAGLLNLLRTPAIQRILALTNEQKESLNDICEDRAQFSQNSKIAIEEFLKTNGRSKLHVFHQQWQLKGRQHAILVHDRLMLNLDQTQKKVLAEILISLDIKQRGVPIVLLQCDKYYETRLQITTAQRDAMIEQADSLGKNLKSRVIEIEREFNNKLRSVLTRRQEKQLSELTDCGLPLENGNLDLYSVFQFQELADKHDREGQHILELMDALDKSGH